MSIGLKPVDESAIDEHGISPMEIFERYTNKSSPHVNTLIHQQSFKANGFKACRKPSIEGGLQSNKSKFDWPMCRFFATGQVLQ